MQDGINPDYDVIIMGGGPAGSTLGALLKKRTKLRVAILDSEVFPRDHIGESFAHPVIPAIEDSGALAKVLASNCYVPSPRRPSRRRLCRPNCRRPRRPVPRRR